MKNVLLNKWLYIAQNTPPDFPWCTIVIKPDGQKISLTIKQVEIKNNGKEIVLETLECKKLTINENNPFDFYLGKTQKGDTIWTQQI